LCVGKLLLWTEFGERGGNGPRRAGAPILHVDPTHLTHLFAKVPGLHAP